MYAALKDVLSGYALSARFQSMKLEHVECDLSCMTVLFIANDGQDRFVCSITPNQLDPENGRLRTGDQLVAIFRRRENEIEAAAKKALQDARQNGIKHKPGVKNEPLAIKLQ